ncbi:hypothetical protein ILUMI_24041 [Ignelater luminosus]|uniref:HTH CENPB-type domain-containing protein n=1 Tax=Ignelater luminosus TaxID=2038154 RepID=A0A8K0G1C1_IGNLU|nr:hypothetical protein ILUMI_24041 [Ignelater luminosus]
MSHGGPIMARNRKRKSDKGTFRKDQMKEAVKQVVEKGKSVRGVTGLSFQTLARYVFTNVQEKELEHFILESSKMCFGLRKVAYETAVKSNLRMPDAWVSKQIAGREWTFGFMKRHPRLNAITEGGWQPSPSFAWPTTVGNRITALTGRFLLPRIIRSWGYLGTPVGSTVSQAQDTLIQTCLPISLKPFESPFQAHFSKEPPVGHALAFWMSKEIARKICNTRLYHRGILKKTPQHEGIANENRRN